MFESEQQLVESFIRDAEPGLWTRTAGETNVRTVFESTCSNGRADWVWASSVGRWPIRRCEQTAELLQKPTCSRILSFLKPDSPRSERFLEERSGVSRRTFRKSLVELTTVDLVAVLDDDLFVLGKKLQVPDVEIVAFEFKLDDWQRAFYQATRYRSFSHRVYVVMPASTVHRVNGHLEAFRRQNIGLLSHGPEEGASRILASKKRQPRSRPSFLQALGMLQTAGR